MDKNYEKIQFLVGSSIEDAVKELLRYKEKGILAYGEFNGFVLYSDTVVLDEAYMQIIGKTKTEFDKAQQEWKENYDKQLKEHKEKIPVLTEYWKEKGREVLTEDRWEYWDKIVPVRLNDLYRGIELGYCLDIVKILNNNCTLDEAKDLMETQGHSGMSFGLACAMIRDFCNRGQEFADYVR